MHILFIAPQPFYEDRGTPIAIYETLVALRKLGFQADLATFPIGSEAAPPGVKVIRTANAFGFKHVPIGFSFRKVLLDLCLLMTVLRLSLRNHYDCVHGVEEGAAIALVVKKLFGMPVIYDMQSSMPEQLRKFKVFEAGPGRWLGLRFERWLLKNADCVIASQGLLSYVRHLEPGKKAFECVFEGQDSRPQNAELAKLLKTDERPTVVYTGNFAHYQGLDVLLRAVPLVRAEVPEVIFVLVGGTEAEITRLSRLIKQNGLVKMIRICPRISRKEIPDYLALADVLVLTRPRGENAPLKAFDYLKSGKPIVATNIPGHRAVLSKNTAILTEPTAGGLSRGIIYALKNKDDANKMAAAALSSVKSERMQPLRTTIAEAYRSITE